MVPISQPSGAWSRQLFFEAEKLLTDSPINDAQPDLNAFSTRDRGVTKR